MPETLVALLESLRDAGAAWSTLRVDDLLFGRRTAALVAAVALVAIATLLMFVRAFVRRRGVARRVAVPALLEPRSSWTAALRHVPVTLCLVGLPFFTIALADPYSPLAHDDVSYPGRRIALLIDASSSMMATFQASQLNAGAPKQATFFATVKAAERFIRQRMSGKYRDVIAVIEFGDNAYVVTPFTNDYNNVLLSLGLIGDWTEFMQFPDQGTTIGIAIDQAVSLFKAFDFLNASGNLMVIFSDGQDSQVTVAGKPVSEVLAGAVDAKIPVSFIRVNYNKQLGDAVPDQIWKPAVEKTGGRFYAASDEATILRAIREIDQMSAGTVSMRQYTTQQPEFATFALVGAALWSAALVLKLGVPFFRTFP
jgi:Ca-activated chloride channel homolog